jgi:hypothetical protein
MIFAFHFAIVDRETPVLSFILARAMGGISFRALTTANLFFGGSGLPPLANCLLSLAHWTAMGMCWRSLPGC